MTNKTQTTLERYHEITADADPGSPLERLRFFCSLAITGQDWFDIEPFFDALAKELDARKSPVARAWSVDSHMDATSEPVEASLELAAQPKRRVVPHHRVAAPTKPSTTLREVIEKSLISEEDFASLEHDLIVGCERAMRQRDEYTKTGVSTAGHGGSHDTCFGMILRKYVTVLPTKEVGCAPKPKEAPRFVASARKRPAGYWQVFLKLSQAELRGIHALVDTMEDLQNRVHLTDDQRRGLEHEIWWHKLRIRRLQNVISGARKRARADGGTGSN
jgi:hypothetical protein